MKQSITLIKGENIGIETDYHDALPVNMYAVQKSILGADGYMIEYPGLETFGTGFGIDRGGNYNERFSEHYRVSGTKFCKVDTNGTVHEIGDIPGSDQSTLINFYSFETQGIIANGNFYLYSPTTGLNQVTDENVGHPIDGVWVDFYYFLTDGEYLYHTSRTDGVASETTINPDAYSTAEFMPDPSIGISKNQDNKVMVWGRYSLEYFDYTASEGFAFTKLSNRAQKIGIVATHAKCEAGNNFYITGGRRMEAVSVHLLSLGSSQKVSTREVDKILKQYTEPELSDMRMETRTEDDITFILVHLPNETLCFNENIGKALGKEYAWTILKSDVNGNIPYRGINGIMDARISKWVYGDKQDTHIGLLDNSINTHYDAIVEWLLFTPLIRLETYSIDEISIETIPGHTTDIDAKVAMSITKNGVTYGSEYWQLYGQPNDYGQRFMLRMLGNCDDWIGFKFRGASKSRMAFALMEVIYS